MRTIWRVINSPRPLLKVRFSKKTILSEVSFKEDGDYEVSVSGDLTIHGVTNPVETNGRIIVKNGELKALSSFEIAVADYDIKIPKVVRDNIAKIVRIDVDVSLQELKSKS